MLMVALSSCGDGMIHEYLNSDSTIWTNVPVYVDSTGHAEITVQTDGVGYPSLTILYGCGDSVIDRLHKIDADLIVDGKVIEPSEDNIDASYATTYADFPVKNCCDSLVEKLGLDSAQYMEGFSVGITLNKKYKSLTELPKQLSVRFTSETTGGITDTTFVLTLRSLKDTRAPFRVH